MKDTACYICCWTYKWVQMYKTCWFEFRQPSGFTRGLGECPILSYRTIQEAETFFVKIYGSTPAHNIDKKLPDMLYFHSERSHNQIPLWWQVNSHHCLFFQTLVWNWPHAPGLLAVTQHDVDESPIHTQLLISAGSPVMHACTNNFRLTSG